MQFVSLQLHTGDIAAQRAFYAETLGLPVQSGANDAFVVQAGSTILTFVPAPGFAGAYHFAFNVPRTLFAAARAWIAARVSLLGDEEQEIFTSEAWNAEMIYFHDPAGNILELIARHTLLDDAMGPFGPEHLRCISEIGLPTPDVERTTAALTAALGIAPYGEQSETFAPLGDHHGLLIVVREGRHWFPTETAAPVAPVRLVGRGVRAGQYNAAPLPYEIVATEDEPDYQWGGL